MIAVDVGLRESQRENRGASRWLAEKQEKETVCVFASVQDLLRFQQQGTESKRQEYVNIWL